MIIKPKEFILKNGKKAIFRSPVIQDAEPLIRLLQTMCTETDFLLRTKEECVSMTVEQEMVFIQNIIDNPNVFMLVCELDGKIVGDCQISFNNRYRTKHRAEIGIGILRDYWGLGIGSAFFDEMQKEAERRPDVLYTELRFMEGNTRAKALYEKKGFRIFSVQPEAVRSMDGTLKSLYYMMKKIR